MALKEKFPCPAEIRALLRGEQPPDKPGRKMLDVPSKPGQEKRTLAKAVADTVARNAVAADDYVQHLGNADYAESIAVLKERVAAIHAGDASRLETVLIAQAGTLDAIFTDLSRRAVRDGVSVVAGEVFLRLALKAQSQCRATIEALATIKNPSLVFARQANIAYGHQQVNNNQSTRVRRGKKKNIAKRTIGPAHEK